jgi:hypothetical protein
MRVHLTVYEVGLLIDALDELVVRAPDIVPLGDPEGIHQRAVSARSLAERLRRYPTQWAQEWADRTLVRPRRCIVAGCTALVQCSHGPACRAHCADCE